MKKNNINIDKKQTIQNQTKNFPYKYIYSTIMNNFSKGISIENLPKDENIKAKFKILSNLEPFYSNFSKFHKDNIQNILNEMSKEYEEEKYSSNKIIFKYGDEVDRFFIINSGEVKLYFPYTEVMDMNIDEYYIYILKLRRYNEIDFLNAVLLLNKGQYMEDFDESFNIDNYIYKLYITLLKAKYDQFIKYETFIDKDIKELLLRIEKELIETVKSVMPEKLFNIIEEKSPVDGDIYYKIRPMPKKIINELRKQNFLNQINIGNDYSLRISPTKVENIQLTTKKIITMKYLYIKTLKKGDIFGDFNKDSLYIFSHDYINISKISKYKRNLHKFKFFRNLTAISQTDVTLLSFSKKIYMNYFEQYIGSINFDKKKFLLNNSLFTSTENSNLLKTYSICFQEKVINEGEIIISENQKISDSNIYAYFVFHGEFQSYCTKSIDQIDEVIEQLGHDKLELHKKNIKELINNTKYQDLIRKPINMKLNYFGKNDIIGLTESFKNDVYFVNVQCKTGKAKVYYVDLRIIKLFVDSDDTIRENKNKILYNKYKLLSNILLNQRKIYFSKYLNIHGEEKKGVKKIILRTTTHCLSQKKTSLNICKKKLSPLHIAKTSKRSIISKSIKNFKKLKNIDLILVNSFSRVTMQELKELKLFEYDRILMENRKQNKIKKVKIFPIKKSDSSSPIINLKFTNLKKLIIGNFQKRNETFLDMAKIIPSINSKDSFKTNEYDLVLKYQKNPIMKSFSTSEINPLIVDDFNRNYNTAKYFRINNTQKNSIYENLEHTIKLNVEEPSIKPSTKLIKTIKIFDNFKSPEVKHQFFFNRNIFKFKNKNFTRNNY